MLLSEGTLCGLPAMVGFGMGNAIARVPASEIGPLKTLLYPLVSTLYARVFYREKLSKQQYAGIAVSILGLIGVSALH